MREGVRSLWKGEGGERTWILPLHAVGPRLVGDETVSPLARVRQHDVRRRRRSGHYRREYAAEHRVVLRVFPQPLSKIISRRRLGQRMPATQREKAGVNRVRYKVVGAMLLCPCLSPAAGLYRSATGNRSSSVPVKYLLEIETVVVVRRPRGKIFTLAKSSFLQERLKERKSAAGIWMEGRWQGKKELRGSSHRGQDRAQWGPARPLTHASFLVLLPAQSCSDLQRKG